MAEGDTNGAGAPAGAGSGAGSAAEGEQAQVRMNVLGQYIRDLSFENVLAQKGASGQVRPDIQVQLSLEPRKRPAEHQYEIVMRLKITSTSKPEEGSEGADAATLFLMELEYAGLFHVEGVPENQLHPLLLIECPRMLFPFARRIVHDVTRDGGFPPYDLQPIDFVAHYREVVARRAAAQQGEAATPAT